MRHNGPEGPKRGCIDLLGELLGERTADPAQTGGGSILLILTGVGGGKSLEGILDEVKLVLESLRELHTESDCAIMAHDGPTYRKAVGIGQEAPPAPHGLDIITRGNLDEPSLELVLIGLVDRREATAPFASEMGRAGGEVRYAADTDMI